MDGLDDDPDQGLPAFGGGVPVTPKARQVAEQEAQLVECRLVRDERRHQGMESVRRSETLQVCERPLEPLTEPLGNKPVGRSGVKNGPLGLGDPLFPAPNFILPRSLEAFVVTELVPNRGLDVVGSSRSERVKDQALDDRVHARRLDGTVSTVVPSVAIG